MTRRTGEGRGLAGRWPAALGLLVPLLPIAWIAGGAAGCGGAGPLPAARRIVVVGVDGATWSIISPLMEADRLPHLARQYRAGSAGLLRSLRTPGSGEPGEPLDPACLWTTLATGMPPGAHGVTGSAEKIPGRYALRPVTADRRRVPALWTIAGARGIGVGVAGWPVTFPVERVEGFMIASGYDPAVTGERGYLHPPGALGDGEAAGEPLALPGSAAGTASLDPDLAESFRHDLATLSRFLALYRAWQPRLAFLRFESVDLASHRFWQHHETRYRELEASRGGGVDPERAEALARAIPGAYEFLDHWIGLLLDRLPEGATLLMVSPYGFRGVEMIDYIHLDLDRLLGLLGLQTRSPGGPLDWGATRLFDLDGTATARRDLFLNVKGREASGSIDPVAATALRDEIVARLKALRSDGGESLLRSVTPVDRRGPADPDIEAVENLGIRPAGSVVIGSARPLLTSLYRRFSEDFGAHDANGVLLASGGGIAAGRTGWTADLYDVAPTILHLLGIEPVAGMPGVPISGILTEPASGRGLTPGPGGVGAASPDPVHRPAAIGEAEIRRLRSLSHLR